jgi:hypothetical protein
MTVATAMTVTPQRDGRADNRRSTFMSGLRGKILFYGRWRFLAKGTLAVPQGVRPCKEAWVACPHGLRDVSGKNEL